MRSGNLIGQNDILWMSFKFYKLIDFAVYQQIVRQHYCFKTYFAYLFIILCDIHSILNDGNTKFEAASPAMNSHTLSWGARRDSTYPRNYIVCSVTNTFFIAKLNKVNQSILV